MSDFQDKELIKTIFPNQELVTHHGAYWLNTKVENLLENLEKLKNQAHYIFLNDVFAKEVGDQFEVYYHLTSFENRSKLFLKVAIQRHQILPSAQRLWEISLNFEKELWDMLGIKVEGLKDERLINHQGFEGHPLLKSYQESVVDLQTIKETEVPIIEQSVLKEKRSDDLHWETFGPCQKDLRRPLQLMVQVEDDIVKRCLPQIGHVHRGLEKLATEVDFFQFNVHADRINYQSMGMGSISWCKAIEALLEINISDRSKALRMVFLELGRIVDHFTCLANISREISFEEFYWKKINFRELVLKLFHLYHGSKYLLIPARIGGMTRALPNGWSAECMETIKVLKTGLMQLENELLRSRLWMDALRVCDLNSLEAIQLGVSGPSLRACGINFDLRKDRPYYFYKEVEFEVPLGVRGDVHDRFLVRYEEIRQSLDIITQVLDNLPIEKKVEEVYPHDFWFDLEEEFIDREVYDAVESANGEFGFYIQSQSNKRAKRVKINTPSFNHVFSLSTLMKGSHLTNVPLAVESMNIIPTEHDR